MVAGVADARAPVKFRAHDLSVGDARRRAAHDGCKQTGDVCCIGSSEPRSAASRMTLTFAEGLGAVPGAVLGADESGGPVGVHREPRRTLKGDAVVVGEVISQPHPVGWHSRVATVDDCTNPEAYIMWWPLFFFFFSCRGGKQAFQLSHLQPDTHKNCPLNFSVSFFLPSALNMYDESS